MATPVSNFCAEAAPSAISHSILRTSHSASRWIRLPIFLRIDQCAEFDDMCDRNEIQSLRFTAQPQCLQRHRPATRKHVRLFWYAPPTRVLCVPRTAALPQRPDPHAGGRPVRVGRIPVIIIIINSPALRRRRRHRSCSSTTDNKKIAQSVQRNDQNHKRAHRMPSSGARRRNLYSYS
jgi:hypothetical protein